MSAHSYQDRLKADYRNVFGSPAGRNVLLDLYTHLQGNKSSFSLSSGETHFNEGKRWAWLRIMAQLREEDMEMRKLLEENLNERRREEMS